MEPDDLLATSATDGPSGGTEELRAIVARAGRRRWRAVAGGAAVALIAGVGVGYAVSNHTSGGQTVVASSAAPSRAAGTAPTGGSTPAVGSAPAVGTAVPGYATLPYAAPMTLVHAFSRPAGQVTIRAFVINRKVTTMPAAVCGAMIDGPSLQAEVSSPSMVATVVAWLPTGTSTADVTSVTTQLVGQEEGDPTGVVIVKTSANVAKVEVRFAGGIIDEMAPVNGWSVLAGFVPPSLGTQKAALPVVGTLTALDSSSQPLKSMSLSEGTNGPIMKPGISCACPNLPGSAGAKPGSSGSGFSGTASSGSVSSGQVSGSSSGGGTASAGVGAPVVACAGGMSSGPPGKVTSPRAAPGGIMSNSPSK